MKKRNLIKKIIAMIFMVFFIILFIFSLYNIINWKVDTSKNKKIEKEIKEKINVEKKDEIDLDSLKKINQDTVVYLKVNNTNIDNVVLKTRDNDYYLNHNFNKEYNTGGWLFMDYRNKFDGTDRNIIIYGHNMKDGSMFGSLKNVLKKEWAENKDNLEITLISETEEKYKVFSAYVIDAEEYYITTDFNNQKEFASFLKELKSRSYYNFDEDISSTSQILTLSTCSSKNKRVVLHAKKISN